MEKETYNLERLNTIGGRTYNHDGQIIRTPNNGAKGGWLFMGDDYEEYSPLDCLIKNIVEHPSNFDIRGEIQSITQVSQSYDLDYLEVISIDDDGEETTDEIYYEHLSVEVIVHHNTNIEVRRKSA